MHRPALSASAPATADFSLPGGMYTLHTTVNNQRVNSHSRLADLSTRVSNPDHRNTELTQRIQDLNDQRAPLMGKRNFLRHHYITCTSERALLVASTEEGVCALAETVLDSTMIVMYYLL